MIQAQLKLRMTKRQELECDRWLLHLGSIYNWGIRKIELNAKDRIFFKRFEFCNLLVGHSPKLGIPSHVIRGTLATAYQAWNRCFRKLAKAPRLKGQRNRLNSIPFTHVIERPKGNRITLTGLKQVRFHRMPVPEGQPGGNEKWHVIA